MTATDMLVVSALAALPFALVVRTNGRVTPTWVVVGHQLLVMLGYHKLALASGNSRPPIIYLAALTTFVVGYCVSWRGVEPKRNQDPSAWIPVVFPALHISLRHCIRILTYLLLAITALVMVHYSRVGITLLDDNVELARWEYSASGLFGIPARAMLFGTTAITYLTAVVATLGRGHQRSWRLFAAAFTVLLAAKVASGFRGAILEASVAVLLLLLAMHRPKWRARLSRRLIAVILVALASVLVLFPLYGSDRNNLSTSLVTRVTETAAWPGFQSMIFADAGVFRATDSPLQADARALLSSLGARSGDSSFTFTQRVSSLLHNRPLGGELFIVPVTIGASPTLYVQFGYAVFAAMFLLGASVGILENTAYSSRGLVGAIFSVSVLFVIYLFFVRGNLLFNAFNFLGWTAVLVGALLAVALAAGALAVPRASEKARVKGREVWSN